MTIVVENGSRVSGANSYVSEQELEDYAAARGITISSNTEQLLIKSMDFIEALSFIGIKFTKLQPLQWPRIYVVVDSYYVNADEIPKELKKGLMETALAIDNGQDPLADIARLKKAVHVGEISVVYADGQATTLVRKLSNSLYKILKTGIGSSSFEVGRG